MRTVGLDDLWNIGMFLDGWDEAPRNVRIWWGETRKYDDETDETKKKNKEFGLFKCVFS